jgi:hypothetical protein
VGVSHSFVEPRPKIEMMIILIVRHECIWGTVWRRVSRKGKEKDNEW